MSPAKHLAICAEIQQLHQVRIAQLEAKQRTWVGLTMEELATLVVKTVGYPIKLAESIEAKLKEKNT